RWSGRWSGAGRTSVRPRRRARRRSRGWGMAVAHSAVFAQTHHVTVRATRLTRTARTARTVRRAVEALGREGWTVTIQGRGTFVRPGEEWPVEESGGEEACGGEEA